MAARGRLAGAVCFALTAAACADSGVVRVVDGKEVHGRFVSDIAYARYAEGAQAEAEGDFVTAARAFEAVAGEDAPSADVSTRIGAARCRTGNTSAAEAAFADAVTLDPNYATAHIERARCALRMGQLEAARSEATTALALEPEREDASLVLAEALERSGNGEAALRALHGLTILRPTSISALAALHALALRQGARALADDTAERLARLSSRGIDGAGPTRRAAAEAGDFDAIDGALLRHETNLAERLARRIGMPLSEVAVRAAALGQGSYARERAELIVAADPTDGSAHVAAAVACDEASDPAGAAAALALPSANVSAPSPLARLLLVELLERRVGLDAARAYLERLPVSAANAAPRDALFGRTARRVRAALGQP